MLKPSNPYALRRGHKVVEKKILPEYYEAVITGKKKFELRKDEDDIQQGDYILLREFDGEKYTGREQLCDVPYVLRHCPEYGLMDGYCILSIQKAQTIDAEHVRHGHWIVSNKSSWSQCSVCKRHFLYVWDYENADERCRHCGAIMDEPMEVLE